MSANVTALHGGRTRALVQRKDRKSHVASMGPAESTWVAVCGRYIPAAGASFWIHDAATQGESAPDDMCRDCAAICELVAWAVAHALAGTNVGWTAAKVH